jgi:acyl carrier protein
LSEAAGAWADRLPKMGDGAGRTRTFQGGPKPDWAIELGRHQPPDAVAVTWEARVANSGLYTSQAGQIVAQPHMSPVVFGSDTWPSRRSIEAMNEVADKVKKIVAEHLGIEKWRVIPEASFIDDLGADSLDTVELVLAFEEAFHIDIPEAVVEKISIVKDAIDYIEKQKAV